MRQTLYCARCGVANERERATSELSPCAACGSTTFTTMTPALVAYSAYDKRLLRSLRIDSDDAAPQEPDA